MQGLYGFRVAVHGCAPIGRVHAAGAAVVPRFTAFGHSERHLQVQEVAHVFSNLDAVQDELLHEEDNVLRGKAEEVK